MRLMREAARRRARLADYRFVITADGYASVAPARSSVVHGMLWRLTPRDRVTLDALGEYRRRALSRRDVAGAYRRHAASGLGLYRAAASATGGPKPGYMEIVVAAARELESAAGLHCRFAALAAETCDAARAIGSLEHFE